MKQSEKRAEPQELTDDIEVIGPGQMLSEARKSLSLSQEDVANRLNFRLQLVKDIEDENFDKSIPATFNRGYLRNFAKLVNVSEEDIIASYEILDVAEKQGAELQSFSQGTQRQAENSRIKWMSYLMVTIIIGSTLVWFFQEPEKISSAVTVTKNKSEQPVNTLAGSKTSIEVKNQVTPESIDNDVISSVVTNESNIAPFLVDEQIIQEAETTSIPTDSLLTTTIEKELTPPVVIKASVVFTFIGDCWVNIYDATGEHIAWGVKKLGYEMKIEGVAPFNVTLGKPELVTIDYDGNNIDMSQFNRGNIAKFTLPLSIN